MKTLFYKLLGVGIVAFSLYAGWMWMSVDNFATTPVDTGEGNAEFTVPSGAGLNRVAHLLEEEGIISSAKWLRWLARMDGMGAKIHAGEYEIPKGTTARELLQLIASGKVKQYSLTIIEGWTFRQMMQVVNAHPKLRHTLVGKTDAQIMADLGYAGQHPEGRFLPDTYFFPAGMSDVQFLQRAYGQLEQVLQRAWAERDPGLPLKSAYDALILASIVEKETAVASERGQISGVFVRRLQIRMRLQTDPTVIYGMGELYDGNVRRADLLRDTPYNTYTRYGLPPTPIALPSAAAIMAAVHPEPGQELYFVAKGDGSHHFSATIAEHNRAVRQYQLKRASGYRSTPDKGK
ncbi:MAG: endolytic transglycosylase MltG [Gammaproteobacteria bacterium]|nr:endolytic transglycosylase MltG [Gammaproteobacteria bacterium]